MRIAFFGTPQAAVPSLETLIDSSHDVVGVVTAPDRPRGRGMKLDSPPVAKAAVRAGLPLLQTSTVKTVGVQEKLREFGADVFVVVAFGFILPPAVLEMTRFGCINVHFSLLPLLRGAAPVQWALIQGLPQTGCTIMQLDEGMDTGPILARVPVRISPEDNTQTLEDRLAVAGAKLLLEVVDQVGRGTARPVPQDHSSATYAPKISADDAHIDWSEPAGLIKNKVRAFSPRPGAWGHLNGKRLKIWRVGEPAGGPANRRGVPGEIWVEGGRLVVQTGSEPLTLEEIQPEGRSRMLVAEYIRGYRPSTGDRIS